MARRKDRTRPITYRPPFSVSGPYVVDALGMVIAQFQGYEHILVGRLKMAPATEVVVRALNQFSTEKETGNE